jgi:hypothetical protein
MGKVGEGDGRRRMGGTENTERRGELKRRTVKRNKV